MSDPRERGFRAHNVIIRSTLLPMLPGAVLMADFGVPAVVAACVLSGALLCLMEDTGEFLEKTWRRLYVAYFFVATLVFALIDTALPQFADPALGGWVVISVVVMVWNWRRWLEDPNAASN